MGCWNATCNVSHMPIFGGDKIILIPLLQTHATLTPNCCETTDNFTPIGFPITGVYNEYGGIEQAQTHDCNIAQLMSKKYFVKSEDGYQEYIPSNIEDLVNNIFCRDDTFVEINNPYFFPDKKAPVNFMMIHKKLYDSMVQEMGSRIPYGQTNNYRNAITAHFEKILTSKKEFLSLSCELSEHQDCTKADAFKDLVIFQTYREIEQEVLCPYSLHTSQWESIAHATIASPSEIIQLAVEKFLFTHALSACRMGYLCISGMGSQSEETAMQLLIARFIIQHAQKRTKRTTGVRETVFYYD